MNSKKISLFIILFFVYNPFHFVYAQGWQKLTTTGLVTPRTNASAVYIPSQNKMFVFGGKTSLGHTNELWCLNLNINSWSIVTSKSAKVPLARYTHVAMYDSLLNRILIWSGEGSSLYNDVWAFNLKDSTWNELFLNGNVTGAPLKRYGDAATFDQKNRNIISFAGFTTAGRFDDTWSFDVDELHWTDKTNSIFPLKRCLTSSCFARDRREMIVFGGQSTGNLNDIWKLNVDTYNWTNITPTVSPSARHFASMSYCGNENVVVFGGNSLNQGNNAGALNELWNYSLNTQQWDTLPQFGKKPSARFGCTSVYIPSQDKIVVFGGQGLSSLNSETWVYTGVNSVTNGILMNEANDMDFNCYPNPVNTILNIHTNSTPIAPYQATIVDVMGRKLMHVTLTGQKNSIDLSTLENGFYTIIIETGTKKISKRLIKTE